MPIVDDYAAIAAELRRLRAGRRSEPQVIAEQREDRSPQHRMRETTVGELLYRRLVARIAEAVRRRGAA